MAGVIKKPKKEHNEPMSYTYETHCHVLLNLEQNPNFLNSRDYPDRQNHHFMPWNMPNP